MESIVEQHVLSYTPKIWFCVFALVLLYFIVLLIRVMIHKIYKQQDEIENKQDIEQN